MSYVLDSINYMNKIFQSEKTMIHLLYPIIKQHFLKLLNNFIKKEFVSTEIDFENEEIFVPALRFFCGLKFEKYEQSLSEANLFEKKKQIL